MDTLSKHESFIRKRSGSIEFLQNEIHISLLFFEFNSMLFVVAQFWRPSSTFCIFGNSPFGILSDAVQSSAYLDIFTRPCSSTGIESLKSSIKIPNSKGGITDLCGTPAGQVRVVGSTPGSLTCCVLPWRKLCIHCHKDLLIFLPLSLDKRMEWSTRSKALLKSINKEWIASFPSAVLWESFNHVCLMFTRADTVERPWEKACWFS